MNVEDLNLSSAAEAVARFNWERAREMFPDTPQWSDRKARALQPEIEEMREQLEVAAPHIVAQAFFLYYQQLGDTPEGHRALYEWQKISRTLPAKPIEDPYDKQEEA